MTDVLPIKQIADNKHSATYPALRTGIYTGALLVIVMLGSLVAANRIHVLERHALERNAISYSMFVIIMLIPVVRFWNRPLKIFGSALIGWTIFVIAYDVAGMVFQNLYDSLQHTPFLALIEGAVVYGVCSVVSWVGGMVIQARRHPIAPERKAANETVRHIR
jgi:uncharacterized membrane-anchored protein YitT (DUF2179 family)